MERRSPTCSRRKGIRWTGGVCTSYIMAEAGVIEKVMPKVKPDSNAADIMEYLKSKA